MNQNLSPVDEVEKDAAKATRNVSIRGGNKGRLAMQAWTEWAD